MNLFDIDHFTSSMPAPENQDAAVLRIPIDRIVEDSSQPRTQFDEEKLQELVESIREHGNNSPIHVRPADENGIHTIISGARRYRASVLAGREWVRAIIEDDAQRFDEYAQVSENTKREGLNALDIAHFIQRRKEVFGEKNKEIAEKLGVRSEYIVHHLALLGAPIEILEAFKDGRIKGAQLAWELCRLYERVPEQALSLLESGADITRRMIREASGASHPLPAVVIDDNRSENEEPTPVPFVVATERPITVASCPSDDFKQEAVSEPIGEIMPKVNLSAPPIADKTKTVRPDSSISTPSGNEPLLYKPVVYGFLQGERVEICIYRAPTRTGWLWVENLVTQIAVEVPAGDVVLDRLEESV